MILSILLIILIVSAALQEQVPRGLGHTFLNVIVLGTFVVAFLSLNFGTHWRKFVLVLVISWLAIVIAGEGLKLFDRTLPSLITLLLFLLPPSRCFHGAMTTTPTTTTTVVTRVLVPTVPTTVATTLPTTTTSTPQRRSAGGVGPAPAR